MFIENCFNSVSVLLTRAKQIYKYANHASLRLIHKGRELNLCQMFYIPFFYKINSSIMYVH